MENLENEDVKSKKAITLERLKVKYPDLDIENEEDVYGRIDADYAESADRLNQLEENERNMVSLFNKDPRSATMLTEWATNGISPIEYLIKVYGDDLREALDDPENADAIAAAHKEYLDNVTKRKEGDEAFKANLEKSLEGLDNIAKAKNLTEEQTAKVWDFIGEIAEKYISGVVDEATIEMALKAINHDVDVDEAARIAEVKAKNARIDELKTKTRVDETMPPAMAGNSNSVKSDGMTLGNEMDIWEKANMKRKRRV